MFFYLSKILAFLISPITWVFIFLLYSFKTKIEGRAKKLRIIAIVVLYVSSNSFVVDEFYRWWEPYTEDHDMMQTKFEGAIVLGGIGNIDERLQKINFGESSDRLLQVIPYFYNGRIKRIVFTSGSGSIEFPQQREAYYVRKWLQGIHFPDSALIIEASSRNTYENAVFTKRILDSLNLKGKYLLVTSAYHMPRAMAVFKKAGYTDLVPYITNKSSGKRRFTPDHLLLPNPYALYSLQFLIHEWTGFLIYKIKGYA
jgi:uncharacterized SAM-binding protein YcdF (DUF218 family)